MRNEQNWHRKCNVEVQTKKLPMKKLYIFFAILFSVNTAISQRVHTEYETDSKWFVGLNAGGIWHTSDVKNKTQIGWGFMLGRSFNYNYGTPISFDLRLRYLRGFWVGQDKELSTVAATDSGLNGEMDPTINYYKADTATVLRNFQNDQHRIGLELAIHANRLRERTGLDLYLFGGIGFTWWQSYSDVLNSTDTSNTMYDYSQLTDFSNSSINAFHDGTYDSPLQGSNKTGYNVTWMPSVGVGIGYQVGPRFQIGLEHKTTFTRTDLWDGKNYNSNGELTGSNDIYHYTGLYLKFNIRKAKSRTIPPEPETVTNPNNNIVPTTNCLLPTIAITNPVHTNFSTADAGFHLRADITHIDGAHQISFKQNGQFNTNFTYSAALNRFDSHVVLVPGQNTIEILVTNTCGTATESRIIILERPTLAPPIVSYQNPPHSPYNTESPVFPLEAQVLNVTSQSQVQMTFNGNVFTSFSFNPQTNKLSAQLSLVEGTNVVSITGTNTAGTDTKQTVIVYKKPLLLQPPVVNFVNPVNSPIEVTQPQASILATVLHVDNQQNITVRVNGQILPQTAFTFNTSNKMVSFTANLIEGANTISVRGTNEAGVDEKSTTIIYKRIITEYPPIVTFLDPIENPITVNIPSYMVRARVQNVANASQITVWVNNVQTNNFVYTASSQEVQLQTGLISGANTIRVRGTNNVGMDEKNTTIIYRLHNPVNPPIVDITSPQGNPAQVSMPSVQVIATVLNVSSQQDINVYVNEQVYSNFNYNSQNHTVTFNAQLNEGMNRVKVTGSNSSGYAEDTQDIRYTQVVTVQPPIVTFVNPNPSPQSVQQAGYEMRATVLNVTNKNQIQVRQNGQIVNPGMYTFNQLTMLVSFNTNLVLGNNLFEVTASNTAGIDTKTAVVNYQKIEVPCDKPTIVFNQPSGNNIIVESAQFSIDVTVNGVNNISGVIATLNGVVVQGLNYNSNTKKLTGNITLTIGFNMIEVAATNSCGVTKSITSIQYVPAQEPCHVPQISRVNPVNQTMQVQQDEVSVIATTVNIQESSQLGLLVNGTSKPFSYDPASHLVSATIVLNQGMNEIRFTAENECGAASVVWNVEKVRCDEPVLNLSSSAGTNNTTNNPQFNISGNIQNVSNNQHISVTHNGGGVNFTYNTVTDVFNSNINLIEGNNVIIVNATNNCGLGQKTYTIVYTPAVTILPPAVEITNPSSTPYQTQNSSMVVVAVVQNVTQASQINVTVNGVQKQFNYNSATQQIQFNQTWVEGVNVIVVTATNAAGSASDTKTVIYSMPQPVYPPVITFTNPVNNPHTVDGNNYTVTGYITNITSINQVQAVLNNTLFSQYTPVLSNGQLNFTIPLTFDNTHTEYTIQFTATNQAGSDQASRTIIRKTSTGGNCMPQVGAVFASNHQSVNVTSTKDLSNVVLKFHDNTTQKFDNLSGYTGTFAGTGSNQGKCIIGVWIKSGCNMSNDGPGYGEWVPNTNYNGQCSVNQPCGPRINPGNSAWQFCLVTPSGTYTRDDLHNNSNFSYTGPATSAYFLPIAGGADAVVGGAPYPVQSGRYYLFTGNLTVDVRSNHPGSMGHWQICIQSDNVPQSGNGNNRPQSPCEATGNTGGNGTGTTNPNDNTENNASVPQNCMPTVTATFTSDHQGVTTTSTKDLSNVVLKFHDNSTQKFDNLTGNTRTFSGTGSNAGKCIVGVWVKSGCNSSSDGPGYGEWVPNSAYNGQCVSETNETPEDNGRPGSGITRPNPGGNGTQINPQGGGQINRPSGGGGNRPRP